MKFINVTVAQLVEEAKGKPLSRPELEAELKELEVFLASRELEELETSERPQTRNIVASTVSIDGMIFRDFSMVANMVFTHEGYVFFSNGIHAFSLRLMMENCKAATREVLENSDFTE